MGDEIRDHLLTTNKAPVLDIDVYLRRKIQGLATCFRDYPTEARRDELLESVESIMDATIRAGEAERFADVVKAAEGRAAHNEAAMARQATKRGGAPVPATPDPQIETEAEEATTEDDPELELG